MLWIKAGKPTNLYLIIPALSLICYLLLNVNKDHNQDEPKGENTGPQQPQNMGVEGARRGSLQIERIGDMGLMGESRS